MKSTLLHSDTSTGLRTYALVFETGDQVAGPLKEFARVNNLTGARFTAIGALREADLAFFEWESRRYLPIPVREQVEVLMLAGDVAVEDDGPAIHAHAVLGRPDGSTIGGHFNDGQVRPTLEVILTELPGHLHKRRDPESGLRLIDPAID